ncbi:MAG: hypothetical protein R6U55_16155 [Desulfovermiculus sp.]
MNPFLIDTHVHLSAPSFTEDIRDVLIRAIAEIKNIPEQEVRETVAENTRCLYGDLSEEKSDLVVP